jgi:hypothetical protein
LHCVAPLECAFPDRLVAGQTLAPMTLSGSVHVCPPTHTVGFAENDDLVVGNGGLYESLCICHCRR